MKKIFAFAILATMLLSGCGAKPEPEPVIEAEAKHSTYIASGRYYFEADSQGYVITDDGNEWWYTQSIISEEPSYATEPVFVLFDDMGTPDDIYDDEILGLVLDRETAIYDNLEEELSENFTVKRDGNVLTIGLR